MTDADARAAERAWIAAAEAAAAQDDHIKRMFFEPPRESKSVQWAEACIYAIFFLTLIWAIFGG